MAFNRTVTLSSQHDILTLPSNAVDGVTECPGRHFVAATGYTTDRWLSIQLGGTYHIKTVTIHARTDDHGMWHGCKWCGPLFFFFRTE